MAELADALGSGLSVRKDMGVQIPLRPPSYFERVIPWKEEDEETQ